MNELPRARSLAVLLGVARVSSSPDGAPAADADAPEVSPQLLAELLRLGGEVPQEATVGEVRAHIAARAEAYPELASTVLDRSPSQEDDPTQACGGVPRSESGVWPSGSYFGPYRILGVLGQGGMGVVYRAEDTRMHRTVALKTIVGGTMADPVLAARLQREVRALSKLRHPNIVTIHEVGGIGGVPYFAMELLRGETVRELVDREGPLRPKAAAKVAREVARALTYAHERGVVHRDLKPQNVMIERVADAGGTEATLENLESATTELEDVGTPTRYRVVLTDFGLARDAETDVTLTGSGQILGTPAYMSPEQAEGDARRVDALSDGFSLGSLLYELLTGRPPFSGRSRGEIVLKVCMSDPTPPRNGNRAIPRDVEVICLKAMSKEREKRYPNARAFAEDLDRFLRGETILAKPSTMFERSWRKIRRNPVVSSLVGALVVAAIGSQVLVWRARTIQAQADEERKRGVEALRLELARSGEALVQAALARRALGDLNGMARFAREINAPIDRLIAQAPGLAEPWYYRGLIERALDRLEEAERCQDRAIQLASAPDAAVSSRLVLSPALYERGTMRAIRYARRLKDVMEEIQRERAPGSDAPTWHEVETRAPELATLREEGISDLRESIEASGGDGARSEARTETARAFLSMLTHEPPESILPIVERALSLDRYAIDVRALQAAALRARGDLDQELACLEEAYASDKGYLPHVIQLVRALRESAERRWASGGDGAAQTDRALGLLRTAREQGQPLSFVSEQEALIHVVVAGALFDRRGDPRDECGKAFEALTPVLEADPSDFEALGRLAGAHELVGHWNRLQGVDPTSDYGEAIGALERALAESPKQPVLMHNLGVLFLSTAQWQASRGADPQEGAQRACELLDRALALAPRYALAAYHGGVARQMLGDRSHARGVDPTPLYRHAVELFEAALKIEPGHVETHRCLGQVYRSWSEWLASQRQDPSSVRLLALKAYGFVLEAAPDDLDALGSVGALSRWMAQEKRRLGEDPTQEIKLSRKSLELALARSPSSTEGWKNLAAARECQAEWESTRAEDPTGAYRAALEAYEKAFELEPGSAELAFNIGCMHQSLADLAWAAEEEGGDEADRAEEAYGRAIELDAGSWSARANRGSLRQARGRIEEAVEDLERALETSPGQTIVQRTLVRALLDLAASRSLASEGRTLVEDPPRKVETEAARRLRDLAFRALDRADELGGPSRSELDGNPAFGPLRSDPRWQKGTSPREEGR